MNRSSETMLVQVMQIIRRKWIKKLMPWEIKNTYYHALYKQVKHCFKSCRKVGYRSGEFAIIFISEYTNIIYRLWFCRYFLGGIILRFYFIWNSVFLHFLWVGFRGSLPRYHCDDEFVGNSFLPLSFLILHLNLVMSFKAIFFT